MAVPRVYIDTNILKFSASALERFVPRTQKINWGGHIEEVVVHDIKIINPNDKIADQELRSEVDLLPQVAKLGKANRLRFQIQVETKFESWGLRNMDSQTGEFYGAEIETIEAPIQYGRVMFGFGMDSERMQYEFLARQSHPRFKELQRATGAFQGNNPLNKNQLLDALHFWCAEYNGCEYFLTLDFKLVRMLNSAHGRKASNTIAVTASQLLQKVAGDVEPSAAERPPKSLRASGPLALLGGV